MWTAAFRNEHPRCLHAGYNNLCSGDQSWLARVSCQTKQMLPESASLVRRTSQDPCLSSIERSPCRTAALTLTMSCVLAAAGEQGASWNAACGGCRGVGGDSGRAVCSDVVGARYWHSRHGAEAGGASTWKDSLAAAHLYARGLCTVRKGPGCWSRRERRRWAAHRGSRQPAG